MTRGLVDATWQGLLPATGGATSIRRLGDILNYGKTYMAGQVGVAQTAGSVSNNQSNTDIVLYHVFGDPTMEMWTGYPYVIKIPRWYELLVREPLHWQLKYVVDGATITALQEGRPIARGLVAQGLVDLQVLGDGSVYDPDKPVKFIATHPDGLSQVLEEETAAHTIGAQGGSLEHTSTGFRLVFPNGAVPGDTTIFYDPTIDPPAPVGEGKQGMKFFELDAFNGDGSVRTQFDQPWRLELLYDDEDMGGVDEGTLQCQYYDPAEGMWKSVQSSVDIVNNKVTCQADHFTEFALVAQPQTGMLNLSVFLPVVTR